jgi:hypothetical protein
MDMSRLTLPALVAAVTLAVASSAMATNPPNKSGTGLPTQDNTVQAQPQGKAQARAPQMTRAPAASAQRDQPTTPGGLTTKRLNEMQLERMTGQQAQHP